MTGQPSVLLLTKTSFWCREAQAFLRQHVPGVVVVEGERGASRPSILESWHGDYLVSFLCPWVLPAPVLSRASRGAINFHPAPPEYPGIGCYNFALYDEVSTYGVTAHHMAPQVDSGAIVAVTRFPVLTTDSVASLKDRSMACLLTLFQDVMTTVVQGEPLPQSSERWTRAPYRRTDLEALCRVTPEMAPAEVRRRVRATTFPGASGAYLDVAGCRFEYAGGESGA